MPPADPAEVQIREIDRGKHGKLVASVVRGPRAHVSLQHVRLDGSLGGRAVLLVSEVPALLDVFRSGQQLANGKHRSVSAEALARQLDEDRRLF
jgi:hypothetical protein